MTNTSAVFLPFPGGCLRPRGNNPADIAKSWQYGINHPDNRIYLSRVFPQTEFAQSEWWQKPDTEKNLVFVIEHAGEAIGTMGVHDIDYIHGHATTGTLIWDKQHWNQGIGTKAKLVLLEYLFDTLNLRQVYSEVIGYNGRSARYSDKCGYREVARLPDFFRFGPVCADKVILLCTRETWQEPFTAFKATYAETDDAMPTRLERVAAHKVPAKG